MYCDLLSNGELCRFCLNDCDETAVSLKNDQILVRVDKKIVDLKEILKFLLLDYSNCENLPSLVCNECKSVIINYYSLKKTFLENQKTLSSKSPSKNEILQNLVYTVEAFFGTLSSAETINVQEDANKIIIEKTSEGSPTKQELSPKKIIIPVKPNEPEEHPEEEIINYIHYDDAEFIEEEETEKTVDLLSTSQAEVHDEQSIFENEDVKFDIKEVKSTESVPQNQEPEYEVHLCEEINENEESAGSNNHLVKYEVESDQPQEDSKVKIKGKRKHRATFENLESGLIAKKFKVATLDSNIVLQEDDESNNYMCSNCSAVFTNEKAANDHVLKYGKFQYCTECRCDECSVIFSSHKLFQKHRSYHILSKISSIFNYHDCPTCKVTFGNEKDYEKHLDHHAGDENFSYTFEGRPQLEGCEIINQRENLEQDEVESWICGHCGMKFCLKNEINFHLTLFHANLYCPFCSKQSYGKSVSYLIDHLKMKHPEQFGAEDITFSCSHCFEEFITKQDMKEHEKYCNNKKFECTHCNRKFALERQLKEHLESVNGNMKYACTFCDKKFNNKSSLTVHSRIHSKEKPYACNYPGCGKTFRTNSHRSAHMDAHNETKNFKCQYCNCLFQTRAAKRAHEKSHTYTHICPICQKDFKQRSHLVRHANIVHKIICGSGNLEAEIEKYNENLRSF